MNVEQENKKQMATMCANLRALRAGRNLSVEALSLETGVSAKDISTIENGGDVSVDVLLALCAYHGIKPKDMFLPLPAQA